MLLLGIVVSLSNSHFNLSAGVGRESHFESAVHKIEEVGPTRKADIARERAKIIDERFPTYPCLPHTTVWGIQQVQKSVQEKRQNIESRQPRGQILAAMPKVIVQMRAFRFQRIIHPHTTAKGRGRLFLQRNSQICDFLA
jgi:hypothetical protein